MKQNFCTSVTIDNLDCTVNPSKVNDTFIKVNSKIASSDLYE